MFPFGIGLYKPEIPPNTGNISRLCVGLKMPLNIIGKPSFNIDAPSAKRAGLNHWKDLDLRTFASFKEFYLQKSTLHYKRIVIVTKEGNDSHWDFLLQPGDFFLFGNETKGVPPFLLKRYPTTIKIPMWGNIRSLNLSNSVSIIAYEMIRKSISQKLIKAPPEISPSRTFYTKNHTVV